MKCKLRRWDETDFDIYSLTNDTMDPKPERNITCNDKSLAVHSVALLKML